MHRILVLTGILFCACAKQGFPPGGPQDKIPPAVYRTVPEPGAVRVKPDTQVEFRFTENIQPVSSRDAVFITPNPGEVRIKWRMKGIKIRFDRLLEENRTYVVTIGTKIRDYRNNSMAESYSLAFSTGDSIDQGIIKGHVYAGQNAGDIGIWAYCIEDTLEPDPRLREPDYIVQCNDDGRFLLIHMAPRRYRLFAVKDRLYDRLYQPVEDEIGMTWTDADLRTAPYRKEKLGFRMMREDTLAPFIVKASAPHSRLVSVLFSEPVEPVDSLFNAVISLADSGLSTDPLKIVSVIHDSSESEWIHFLTEPLGEQVYSILIRGIRDSAGEELNLSGQETRFSGSVLPDTISPELNAVMPYDRERNVQTQELMLYFSEAMDTADWKSGYKLSDAENTGIPLIFKRVHPARFILTPVITLKNELHCFSLTQIRDLAGNALEDTTIRFTPISRDTLSEISGEITDISQTPGRIFLSALQAGGSKPYSITVAEAGPFLFQDILPGLYTLSGFRDADSSGDYSFGQPFPFIPAERFFISSDTIKVRSKWSNTGNNVDLP